MKQSREDNKEGFMAGYLACGEETSFMVQYVLGLDTLLSLRKL